MQNLEKEIIVDSKLENIETLTHFVESALEPYDPSPKAMMQISVAIDELFSNVVRYSGSSNMKLILNVNEDVLTATLTFIDEGIEYDPLAKKDPDVKLPAEDREIGGLGIFLVKKTMDDMRDEYRDGQNCLTLIKKIR